VRAGGGSDRARQQHRWHDAGKKRVDGRHLESARGAGEKQHRQHGVAGEKSAHGTEREHERRQRLADLAGGDDEAAVEQVGDLADHQREREERHELH
jgi:hypothetical protein